jgi:3-hydroxybenzoate 6-monooxygenase
VLREAFSIVRRVPILIVGGGIGGLALALSLAKHGRRLTLIEKAAEFGEIGAGIQLAPNASWALDALGVLEEIKRHAVFPQRLLWMDALSGERLTALDLGRSFIARYGYAYFVMHRSDLLNVLLGHCQAQPLIALETLKDVVAVEDRETTAVATCADGTAYEADVLIGADGLWSTVRRFIVGDGDPICSEYVAYRGTLPIESVSKHAGLDNVIVWTGPERHLVQYPIRRGELFNQVAVFRSKRYRPDSDDWGTAEELDENFSNGPEVVREALSRFWRNRRWPMFDRLPVQNWSRHRITLLGDAAHPMLQYLAQGACQALEDAVALGDALAAYEDVEAAFRAYETERVERTNRVQTEARKWGDYWHQYPGPGFDRRNAFLKSRPDDDYTHSDWYYGYGNRYAVR